MIKTCEKCGKQFECTHSEDCWCAQFNITKELSEYIGNQYKDCLCKGCLKHYIENEKIILADK
jgi:hypothetical protein